jgi:membrane associated rhomboid family serine protease
MVVVVHCRAGFAYLGGLAGAIGGYVGQIVVVGPLAAISVRNLHSPDCAFVASLCTRPLALLAGLAHQ